MSDDLQVSDELTIPGHELEWRFSTSSGPGGSHAAAHESRVELRWNIQDSKAVSDVQRYRLLEHLKTRLTEDGLLRIAVETERSQHQNREIAAERMAHFVAEGLRHEHTRYATEVPEVEREERLHDKHHQAAIKRERQDPDPNDVDLTEVDLES